MHALVRLAAASAIALFCSPILAFALDNDDMSVAADAVVRRAQELKLHERKEWRRLLHYENIFFEGSKSQADGLNFFVATNGKKNPKAEMEATLRGFFSTEKRFLPGRQPLSLSVYCQFPARFEFLDQALNLAKVIPSSLAGSCAEYDAFLKRTSAKSLTFVFSSFYSANPSSIYGHTFIRLNKSVGSLGTERAELLDAGVNFSADQTTQNPLLYAAYGLTGRFQGHFAVLPYYYKVREYSDYESRDLWEYDLDLTPEEVKRVVAHIWELGTTYFDYYYLTENCSYHMLSLLEAGAPRLDLLKKMPAWILPTDTVKAIFESGIVRSTKLRPSLDTQFRSRAANLDSHQLAQLKALARNSRIVTDLEAASPDGPAVGPEVLDAYIDYVDLHFASPLLAKDPEVSNAKQALLVKRSRLPILPALDFSKLTLQSPHLGHGSARASLGRVRERNIYGTELSFRFAFHDLLDPAIGLPDTSDIQFVDFRIRYWEESRKLRLENFTLLGVANYSPIDSFHRESSWKLKFAAKRFNDRRCESCLGGVIEGGYGYSFQPIESVLGYALAEGNIETSPKFDQDKLVPRIGPTLGVRTRLTPSLAALLEAKSQTALTHPSFTEQSLEARLRWAPSRFGLDLRALWTTENQELTATTLLYF